MLWWICKLTSVKSYPDFGEVLRYCVGSRMDVLYVWYVCAVFRLQSTTQYQYGMCLECVRLHVHPLGTHAEDRNEPLSGMSMKFYNQSLQGDFKTVIIIGKQSNANVAGYRLHGRDPDT